MSAAPIWISIWEPVSQHFASSRAQQAYQSSAFATVSSALTGYMPSLPPMLYIAQKHRGIFEAIIFRGHSCRVTDGFKSLDYQGSHGETLHKVNYVSFLQKLEEGTIRESCASCMSIKFAAKSYLCIKLSCLLLSVWLLPLCPQTYILHLSACNGIAAILLILDA